MDALTGTPRSASALRTPGDLAGYPRTTAKARFRSHLSGRSPWFYASAPASPDDGGRFDLPDPDGTCYVASSLDAALRERVGPTIENGYIWDNHLWRTTDVSELDPTDRHDSASHLAHSKRQEAASFHNDELSTCPDYGLTQLWAAAFHGVGFGGIRYQPRFSTGSGTNAEAWFGAGGPVKPEPPFRVLAQTWRNRYKLKVRPMVLDATKAIIWD